MPTDAIREAMATVRDYWSHKPVDRDRYNEACQTLARWLVQHAGELVRKVKCDPCGGDGFAWDPDERDEHGDAPCERCNANGYTLEPLFGEGGK